MPTVELLFSAQPEHVRTARLVAAAVARRAGVDEAALDEVRLAVGEACSRAVGLHRNNAIEAPVQVRLTEDDKKFSIEVADEVPGTASGSAPDSSDEPADDEGEMGLAVISGLVDDFEVLDGEKGGVIRMSWPTVAP
jgi:anti-sigma regulatory factor (Ser/Thr protein kinase)